MVKTFGHKLVMFFSWLYELPSETEFHWFLMLIQYYSHRAMQINRPTIRNRLGIKVLDVDGSQWA